MNRTIVGFRQSPVAPPPDNGTHDEHSRPQHRPIHGRSLVPRLNLDLRPNTQRSMHLARRLLQATAVLVAAMLGLASLVDVARCGSIVADCPGTPMWHFTTWVAGHPRLALAVATAYALAVVALFGKEIPRAAAAAIKPRFALRAAAYILAIMAALVLATHFSAVSSFLR